MKIELIGKTLDNLQDILVEGGFPKFRAKQVMDYVYKRHITDFEAMLQLPAALRAWLKEHTKLSVPTVISEQIAPDKKTMKLLLELEDKSRIETVLMKQPYGNSVCVSSQVGCAMGCIFCASTQNGLIRNLSASEIVSQVLLFSRLLQEDIHSIVVMGAGEPLQNYEEVIKALRFLHEKESFYIGYRRMTLSTCGLVEGIHRLSEEGIPITLALSLHAPNDEIRHSIMPISKHYALEEVMEAVTTYYKKTDRRITFEYILIDKVNASLENAKELGQLVSHCPNGNVNLIPVNGNEHISLYRPSKKAIEAFAKEVEKCGIAVTVRKEMGAVIQAACGQLKAAKE